MCNILIGELCTWLHAHHKCHHHLSPLSPYIGITVLLTIFFISVTYLFYTCSLYLFISFSYLAIPPLPSPLATPSLFSRDQQALAEIAELMRWSPRICHGGHPSPRRGQWPARDFPQGHLYPRAHFFGLLLAGSPIISL